MYRRKKYFVYILTNSLNTVFYIGVTNNFFRRLGEHAVGFMDGFTKKYKVKKLVYLEEYSDVKEAIAREKQLKNWHRQWKIKLIKKDNPHFKDLMDTIMLGLAGRDAETSSA